MHVYMYALMYGVLVFMCGFRVCLHVLLAS